MGLFTDGYYATATSRVTPFASIRVVAVAARAWDNTVNKGRDDNDPCSRYRYLLEQVGPAGCDVSVTMVTVKRHPAQCPRLCAQYQLITSTLWCQCLRVRCLCPRTSTWSLPWLASDRKALMPCSTRLEQEVQSSESSLWWSTSWLGTRETSFSVRYVLEARNIPLASLDSELLTTDPVLPKSDHTTRETDQ